MPGKTNIENGNITEVFMHGPYLYNRKYYSENTIEIFDNTYDKSDTDEVVDISIYMNTNVIKLLLDFIKELKYLFGIMMRTWDTGTPIQFILR